MATRKTTAKKPTVKKTTKAKTDKLGRKNLAEQICANVEPDIKDQAVTLANAVLAMQDKIEAEIPDFKSQPLSQAVTVSTGETVLRENPAVKEFRAIVRDYAQALKNLDEILANQKTQPTASAVDDLRNRFKVG